ncbi:hypothetical protein A3A14_00605 [Candidatus Daviesbacteria bacterium RIFCSPLOWO2_01_FULL_43_38]|uniref:Uncharacterized protein n=1 Tax=Candidatus Daviesbacteria bacterium RIFCSPHIGHO2_12_FULL_43_11 TaxID=1797780 RepID=A0A1F5K6L5_9BACT|nr:MAG: hypothetical protein A3E45_00760 [Candidatus Daviesbacteria bacterium RIFCSPHIGHO2_12_FULL_43_11]OGE63191.1 MAG: hypothetical protein A3A14_00605 [Candidatus Daviesbacteria bacterium RIFCSPLOWO2_01_FULL_43_38]
MNDKPLVTFDAKLPKLSDNERKVLDLLLEAGRLIVPIYEEQENYKFPGANFYPHGVLKSEIEKAAKENPEILSPYTVVEKIDNKLVATPYHKKYAKLLKPVVEKLLVAAEVTSNKNFAECLKVQAKALLDGSYDEATICWMSVKPYILDINIGPVERYDDKLFFVKTAYQAWVGVIDKKNSQKLNKYKDVILSTRRKVAMASEKFDYYGKVQTRIDNTLLFAGLIARTKFVGVNLPNDPKLMEKYGSEITLFKEMHKLRFETALWPTFNRIFSPEFKKQFSAIDLERGSLYLTALHELAHTYLRYRDSEKRLQDLFPVIDELAASVMGIKMCGSLLLKDIASTQQLESIMLAFITRAYNFVLNEEDKPERGQYVIGGAVLLNFLLESGAIKRAGGVSWPNFMKMFVSFDELMSILGRVLSRGKRSDAEALIKKYGSFTNLRSFN